MKKVVYPPKKVVLPPEEVFDLPKKKKKFTPTKIC